ncbi:nitroreductase family protein [Uliginosibacterium sp. H1]|uniref:nitroreductase family protein n=1 Tax=Uliginosibacterium sp. H1 TaxID=3114757 RepID=UPI002E17D15F|nr:nitroreductase family protein [Uliginosibacterium sp. H1]
MSTHSTNPTATNTRQATHPVAPQFLSRWSARALSAETIPDEVLFTAFEAARWAPSGGNAQASRFVYAKRDSARWQDFLGLLNERNQSWAKNASALVVVISAKTRKTDDGQRPHRSHSFDAGAAWSAFAHQAHLLGWSTRAMGGFDIARAHTVLGVPEDHNVEVVIAIGKPADKSVLPEHFQAQEQANGRLPLSQLVAEGSFAPLQPAVPAAA